MITGIDHFVMTVADVEQTCAFYSNVLDLEVVTFGDDRRALQVGEQKINLHPIENDIELTAERPEPGADDFCLLTDLDPDAVIDRLETADVDVLLGPVDRTGARGPIRSVYFRDPDGNLVEVATYDSS